MPQAVLVKTLDQPTMAEINHVTFTGDFTDSSKIVISVSLIVKDDTGSKVEDLGILVDDVPLSAVDQQLTQFQNVLLPKIVGKVETTLGVTFE
jgi:hypothetical protein